MFKMDLIPAKGEAPLISTTNPEATIPAPGTTVKLTLDKAQVVGAKKVGDTLVILLKDGSNIKIDEFFKEGAEQNKLIVDDGGTLYQGQYNTDNFDGINFVKSTGAEESTSEGGEAPLADWVVPVILGALGLVGVGAIVANGSDSGGISDHPVSDPLAQAQEALQSSKEGLDEAASEAETALATLSETPDGTALAAATAADAALQSALTAWQQSYQQLSQAIETASAQGADTKEAEALLNQMSGSYQNAEALTEKLAVTQQAVNALSAMQTQEISELTSAAMNAAALAKTSPNQENLNAAQAALEALKTALQPANDDFQQAIAAAESLGVNTDSMTSAGEAVYQNSLAAVGNALSEARENLQTLEAAQNAIEQAETALESAAQAQQSAQAKLEAALTAKQQALDDNQLDQIDSVNQAIAEANQAIEAARLALEEANALVKTANESIDKISPEITDKPAYIETVDSGELNTIDSMLTEEQPKSFLEALSDFGNSLMSVVTDITNQIKGSTLVKMVTDLVGNVVDTVEGVPGIIWDMISSPFAAIGTATQSIIKLFSAVKGDIGEIVTTVITTVKDTLFSSVADVGKGIVSGISEALSGMELLDWVNPTKWVSLVKNAVTNSFNNVMEALWETIESVPTKISDAIKDIVGTVTEGVAQDIQIVKEGFDNVINLLYESLIKNPFELLVKPITDAIGDIIANPAGAIGSIIDTVATVIKEGGDILNTLFEMPGKALDVIKTLISDVYNSFTEGKVTEIDVQETEAVVEIAREALSSEDTGSDDSILLKTLLDPLPDNSGEINLDEIVPQSTSTLISSSSVTDYAADYVTQTFLNDDELITTAII